MDMFTISWIKPNEEMILGFVYNPNVILVYAPEEEGDEEKVDLKQSLTVGFLFFRMDLILNK